MNNQTDASRKLPHPLANCAAALTALIHSNTLLGATAAAPAPSTAWNLLIALIVFSATVGSIVLNFAAIRQWDRNWGLVSGLPILGLMLWAGIIVMAKYVDPATHSLWALEIFAWAMMNMIYMVTVMTAKRMFAKRDAESQGSAPLD